MDNFLTTLREFMRDLRAQKLRTALTIFGIVWGTVAIVVLLAFGMGFKRQYSVNMHGIGESIAIMFPGSTTRATRASASEGRSVLWRRMPGCSKTGIPYVNWPESVISNPSFRTLIRELEEGSAVTQTGSSEPPAENASTSTMRDKFEAKLRTTDGHYVRSKAEMLIDHWLYMAELVHAYERKLPVEEELYSDFYIPAGKVYIEYWGYENDPKYLARKQKKREIYAKYGFKLIELEEKDIQNLDYVLPRLLLKHGVESY